MNSRRCCVVIVIGAAVAAAGCGGASGPAPSGSDHGSRWQRAVVMVTASFPSSQRLAEKTEFVLAVRNRTTHAIPNLAATICNVSCGASAPDGEGTSAQPFAQDLDMAGLGSRSRSLWIVDQAPGGCGYSCRAGGAGGAVTSYSNTWALGRLAPHATARFVWQVAPVAPGRHVIAWELAGRLDGDPTLQLAGGTPARGTLMVVVQPRPRRTYITDSGRIAAAP